MMIYSFVLLQKGTYGIHRKRRRRCRVRKTDIGEVSKVDCNKEKRRERERQQRALASASINRTKKEKRRKEEKERQKQKVAYLYTSPSSE